MTELFLIAHKVRGEPAFDVATQIECPECTAQGCIECDGLGYWWIIPTSGHRAYPWWHHPLDGLGQYSDVGFWPQPVIDEMPEGLPDHYTTRAQPTLSLADALGLSAKPKPPSTPIVRRF